jgi:hypothetical protein
MIYDEEALVRVLGEPQRVFRDERKEHVFTVEGQAHVLFLWVFPDEGEVTAGIIPATGGEQIANIALRNVTNCSGALSHGREIVRVHSAGLPDAPTGFVLEIYAGGEPRFIVRAA